MPAGKVKRKNVRCAREVAYLIAQSTSYLITSEPTINSPSPSTVLSMALDRQAELEASFAQKNQIIDYRSVMQPDIDRFSRETGLPPANSLSGRYLFSISGSTVIRKLELDCAQLTVTAYDCAVKPEYAIRLALRVLLLSGRGYDAVPALPADGN